jgi:RNA polymerase sigma-70 factor, ECF subfamily
VTFGGDGEVPPIGMTDGELVRSTLDGDARAFTELVDRHAPACLRYATRMLGERSEAEDVAQESFLRAHRALATYDARLPFRTWLFAILINRCRTAMSRRARRERVVLLDDEALDSSSTDDERRAADLRDEIEWAVGRLGADQREAFLLRHVEELSYEEMATATGAGISALKMRVKRACERLQVLLAERVEIDDRR